MGARKGKNLETQESEHSQSEECENDDIPEVLDRVHDGRDDGLEAGDDSHGFQGSENSEDDEDVNEVTYDDEEDVSNLKTLKVLRAEKLPRSTAMVT